MGFKGFGKFLAKAAIWAAGHTDEIQGIVDTAKKIKDKKSK